MTSLAGLMTLHGRHVLITGGAGGIGRVFAATLAELGARLTLVDRPGSDYASLVTSIQQDCGVEVSVFDCDLESSDERKRLIGHCRKPGGRLDVLVNNAAFVGTAELQGWAVPFEEQSVETWKRALEVNLTAVFELSQGLAPILRESPGGSIVNIASIYALHGPDPRLYEGTSMGNPAAYAASKGGLVQLTRWLSTMLAPAVRVNAIAPGGVFRGQPAVFVERYSARTPLGRMAVEDDFRGAIAYLASDASKYVTGQILAVDGGWGVW